MYDEVTAGEHDRTLVATHPLWQVEVARHHLSTCEPGGWLADPIVNMYMALLQARPVAAAHLFVVVGPSDQAAGCMRCS